MTLPGVSQPHHLEAERARLEVIRAMSPARKLEIAAQWYWSARELKAAGLKQNHPDWTEAGIQEEVRRISLYARTERLLAVHGTVRGSGDSIRARRRCIREEGE